MPIARYESEAWSDHSVAPVEALTLHPGTHALHYGSSCFEGLKAHRGIDGKIRVFRMQAHIARMRQSAELMGLPIPHEDLLTGMITDAVAANAAVVPDEPGSLYLRPTLLGADVNIGAATVPSSSALLYVLTSPVGEYFSGALTVAVETRRPRTTPQFGKVKSGANYAMALPVVRAAKQNYGADQVLFAKDAAIQESGAANVFLLRPGEVVTPALTDDFLHGVTRDSVIQLALDLGYELDQRGVSVDEVMAWMPAGEVALSGTAAILAPVERLVRCGTGATVTGTEHAETERLRNALRAVQIGKTEDSHGWLTSVGSGETHG